MRTLSLSLPVPGSTYIFSMCSLEVFRTHLNIASSQSPGYTKCTHMMAFMPRGAVRYLLYLLDAVFLHEDVGSVEIRHNARQPRIQAQDELLRRHIALRRQGRHNNKWQQQLFRYGSHHKAAIPIQQTKAQTATPGGRACGGPSAHTRYRDHRDARGETSVTNRRRALRASWLLHGETSRGKSIAEGSVQGIVGSVSLVMKTIPKGSLQQKQKQKQQLGWTSIEAYLRITQYIDRKGKNIYQGLSYTKGQSQNKCCPR